LCTVDITVFSMNLFLLFNRRPVDELSPEERDARTVFCMQLSQRIRARDLEEFFSSVGKVHILITYPDSNLLAHIKKIVLARKHFLLHM
jgi:RNA recognition motif-containing protein